MTGQVYIGKVVSVSSIPNADRIEAVEVVCGAGGKWRGVVQKGQFSVRSLCQVYLPDSLLPQIPDFAFMEKHQWRVRMARIRGCPSEVLIWPQTIDGVLGEDVTEQASVTKYEKPVPLSMAGEMAGPFPGFIPKTDEPNYQRVPEMVEAIKSLDWYATVKLDGASGTVYRRDGHLGVCSRNWEMKDTPGNLFWRCVKDTYLQGIPEGYAVQFEAVGPGIQSNPAGLNNVQPFAFQIYEIQAGRYLNYGTFFEFCRCYNLQTVAEIAPLSTTFDSDDALLRYAEGSYPNGKPREGLVIRPTVEIQMPVTGERLSFKVINLQYRD